ncbi:MAG: Holliday junction branch migration protein RuvA [Caldilineales bacterium]|nr:Holliday junction branch migration protein RuvA [Caldilineales bacterium]
MISRIRGRIEQIETNFAVVDVGAFGVNVFLPPAQLRHYQPGQAVALFTFLHLREQELALFGFESEEELQLFQVLLGVAGVGPRLALNILSHLTPDALRLAVANDEPALLTRVPGIGVKNARKILFYLKDKIAPAELDAAGIARISEEDAEVIDALTTLGYSVVEAQRAVQRLPAEAQGVEERLRAALTQLAP